MWPHRACYEGAGGSCGGPGPDRDRVRVRAGPFVSGPMAHPWCGVRVQVRADGGRAEREEPFHNLSALCGLVLIGVADPVSEPEGAVALVFNHKMDRYLTQTQADFQPRFPAEISCDQEACIISKRRLFAS